MTHPLTTGWVEPASAIIGTLIQSSLIVSHMLKYIWKWCAFHSNSMVNIKYVPNVPINFNNIFSWEHNIHVQFYGPHRWTKNIDPSILTVAEPECLLKNPRQKWHNCHHFLGCFPPSKPFRASNSACSSAAPNTWVLGPGPSKSRHRI